MRVSAQSLRFFFSGENLNYLREIFFLKTERVTLPSQTGAVKHQKGRRWKSKNKILMCNVGVLKKPNVKL
jgi:hypothetical protein